MWDFLQLNATMIATEAFVRSFLSSAHISHTVTMEWAATHLCGRKTIFCTFKLRLRPPRLASLALAGAQIVTVKPTGCGFDPYSRRLKYLLKFIFPFLRSGVEAKRSVEFCHSTRNASRIRQKWGTECLNTRFPLPILLCAG